MKPLVLATSIVLFAVTNAFTQCAAGETSVTFVMHTDPWAYENYWQLNLAGTGCNASPIAEGANLNVGCAGTESDNSANGYANNSTITEGPFCLTNNTDYEIVYVDSYGDGGMVIEVFENGALTHVYSGGGSGNTWTFTIGVSNAPTYDSPCGAVEITADGPSVVLNNTEAIAGFGEIAPAGVDCGVYGFWCEGNATNSIWAKFIPTTSSTSFEVTTCNPGTSIDTQIAIYKVTDCADFSTFELISSNDDMLGGCSAGDLYASQTFTSCLEAGQLYLIQIDGWEGAVGDIELSLHTYSSSISWDALVDGISCPLDKGETGDGNIYPYSIGAGANFTSVWSGPGGFTSTDHFIQNVDPGTYTLTATTGCGQTFTQSYEIVQPEPWTVTTDISLPSCDVNNDATILVNVGGATAPYIFTWNDETGTPVGNENPLTGVGIGSYEMNITDENSCVYSYIISITDCVGIEEMEMASLNVFPNPSKGSFTINHDVLKNASWSLYDISGKLIHSERIASGSTNTLVNLNIPSGVYSVRITAEDMQLQKSVIVE
ncbi:MAG: hypothetical protein RLZZ71_1134 [Bacteroidota bacterium]|jgi:hypothetical protein